MILRQVTWRSLRVWQRNRDVFFRYWKAEAVSYLIEPLLILLIMGLGLGSLIGLVGGQSYLQFIAPGIVASYAMFSANYECNYGSYVRMEYQRTYDAMIATPVSIEDVIVGEILWAGTRCLLTAGTVMAVISAFGLIHSPLGILTIFVSAIEGLMFGAIALSFTAVTP